MITIAIADDHQIVLDGLCSILEKEETINVAGTSTNGKDLLAFLRKNPIDVAVLDIEMPDMNGIELTQEIRSEFPEVKVILLTMYKTAQFVNKAIEAGAMGYLLKERGQEELVSAIKQVYVGKTFLGEKIMDLLVEGLRTPKAPQVSESDLKMTKRERDVLAHIMKGLSTKEIAKKLFIEPTTVESHKQHLFAKTGVRNIKELIVFAYSHGLN